MNNAETKISNFINSKIKNKRNSLISTSSTIQSRNQLQNDFVLINKFGQLDDIKKFDFPICISIFTNNFSINENNINIRKNQKNKNSDLKFECLNKNKKNKVNNKITGRNPNFFLLDYSQSINSNIKNNSSILDNISTNINNSLYKLSQKNLKTIKNTNSSIKGHNISLTKNKKYSLNKTTSSFISDKFKKEKKIKKIFSTPNISKIKNNKINAFQLYINKSKHKNEFNKLINENKFNNKNNYNKIKINIIKQKNNQFRNKTFNLKNYHNISKINKNKKRNNNNLKKIFLKTKKEENINKSNKFSLKRNEKDILEEVNLLKSCFEFKINNIRNKFLREESPVKLKNNLEKLKKNKNNLKLKKKKINNNIKFLSKINQKRDNNCLKKELYNNKSKLILNFKRKLEIIINSEKNKIHQKKIYNNIKTFSWKDNYIQDINNKLKINNSKEINIKNKNHYKYNCKLCLILKNYINSYEFIGLSLSINNQNKKGKQDSPHFIEFNSSENFLLKHSNTSYLIHKFKAINISSNILKSFYFYKDNHSNKNNIRKFSNSNINKISKKLKYKTINSKELNTLFKKDLKNISMMDKNIQKMNEKKKIMIQEYLKNLKNPTLKRNNDININLYNYSILYNKDYFEIKKEKLNSYKWKKYNSIDEKEVKENLNNNNEIYFKLIEYIIDGENNLFINYYKKNKNYIDINQELYEGNNLLIISCKEGNYHISKFLCEEGSEVNNQNYDGNTAFHFAIGYHFYHISDLLSRYGAREDIKNKKGLTAWDYLENNINFNY